MNLMDERIILWSKPSCVQCDAVKRRIVDKVTGIVGDKQYVLGEWERLKEQGIVAEFDLTLPEWESQLNYFKGLGYTSAPLTEYGTHLVPGYIQAQVDDVIAAWRSDHAHV